MAKVGRPTKYDPKMCEILIEVMKKGFSFEAVAGHLGICKDTLYEWVKAHPEFADAKNQGLEYSRMFWENLGVSHAVNQYQGDTLNTAAWIFNMKNRFGWKDKKETEVSGKFTLENLLEESKE